MQPYLSKNAKEILKISLFNIYSLHLSKRTAYASFTYIYIDETHLKESLIHNSPIQNTSKEPEESLVEISTRETGISSKT